MKPNTTAPMVRCMIIDDEIPALDLLEKQLSAFPSLKILAKISDPEKALPEILKHKPDLLFLDIQMPGKNGFSILEALHQTTINPFVIFVTAFDQFVIHAIRASVFDFLLKPVDDAELAVSVERFLKKFHEQKEKISYASLLEQMKINKMLFNTTGGFTLINPAEILYVQSDWNYSEIHYSSEKFELVTLNLGMVEKMLPPNSFFRISRSVIINLSYLEKVNRKKRLCILQKDNISYGFRIPLLRIRDLEKMF